MSEAAPLPTEIVALSQGLAVMVTPAFRRATCQADLADGPALGRERWRMQALPASPASPSGPGHAADPVSRAGASGARRSCRHRCRLRQAGQNVRGAIADGIVPFSSPVSAGSNRASSDALRKLHSNHG